MYHAVPLTGFSNHGLINYNMRAFFMLCKANRYEPLNVHIDIDERQNRLNGDVTDFAAKFMSWRETRRLRKRLVVTDALVRLALRTTTAESFRAPLDLPESKADEGGDERGDRRRVAGGKRGAGRVDLGGGRN